MGSVYKSAGGAGGAGDRFDLSGEVAARRAAKPQAGGPEGVIFVDVVKEPAEAALVGCVGAEGIEGAAIAVAGAGHRVTTQVMVDPEQLVQPSPAVTRLRNVSCKGLQLLCTAFAAM